MEIIGFAASLPVLLGVSFGSFWLVAGILEDKRLIRTIWLAITAQILFTVAVRLVLLAAYGAPRAVAKFPLEFGIIGTLAYLLCPIAIGTLSILLVRSATTNRIFQTCTGTASGLFAFALVMLGP